MDDLSPSKIASRSFIPFSNNNLTYNDFEQYQDADLGQKLHYALMHNDISEKERVDIEAVIIKYIEFLEAKNFELTNN